jgi:CheY-like chemotaxis protein
MASNAESFRILIVDDDPLMLKLFGSWLGEGGFSVSYAHGGMEARDMTKRVKPQLIILDIMMPEMNGLECFGALREDPETKNIPVLFLTHLEDRPEDIDYAKRIGALGVIHKSIERTEFVSKIKSIASKLIEADPSPADREG